MKRALLLVLLLSLSGSAWAGDYEDCRDAIQEYNTSYTEAYNAATKLAKCIANSAGKEDCSSEMSRTKSEYSDFESDVSDINSYCE